MLPRCSLLTFSLAAIHKELQQGTSISVSVGPLLAPLTATAAQKPVRSRGSPAPLFGIDGFTPAAANQKVWAFEFRRKPGTTKAFEGGKASDP